MDSVVEEKKQKVASAFYVSVNIYAPYPIASSHTIKASKPWTAGHVAVKAAYKALPKDRVRKVDFYTIKIKRV